MTDDDRGVPESVNASLEELQASYERDRDAAREAQLADARRAKEEAERAAAAAEEAAAIERGLERGKSEALALKARGQLARAEDAFDQLLAKKGDEQRLMKQLAQRDASLGAEEDSRAAELAAEKERLRKRTWRLATGTATLVVLTTVGVGIYWNHWAEARAKLEADVAALDGELAKSEAALRQIESKRRKLEADGPSSQLEKLESEAVAKEREVTRLKDDLVVLCGGLDVATCKRVAK